MLPAVNAHAQTTFIVTEIADSGPGSLRQAILDANAVPGIDAITFNLSYPATIELDTDLPSITDDLTINGPGAELLTIDGNEQAQAFNAQGNITLVIENLRVFQSNSSSQGGALLVSDQAAVTLRDCVFEDNYASREGGVVHTVGTLVVERCEFINNYAYYDGGVFFIAGGTATITDSLLYHNSSSRDGGGLVNYGETTIIGTNFEKNTARTGAAGIDNFGTLVYHDGEFADHRTGENDMYKGDGSAIRNAGNLTLGPNVTIRDSTNAILYQHFSTHVTGAILNKGESATLNVTDTVIFQHMYALDVLGGTVIMEGAQIHANTTRGIEVRADSNVTIHNSCFAGNGFFAIESQAIQVDATSNFWGALDGPGSVGPGGGDNVSDYVDYGGWLALPPEHCDFVPWVTTTTNNGSGSLRQAILDANTTPGEDYIWFVLPYPTAISLPSPLPIVQENIILQGPGVNSLDIQATGSGSLFTIAPDVDATIAGLTMRGGDSSIFGGAVRNRGNLTMADVAMRGFTGGRYGGALFNDARGTALLNNDVIFENNRAQQGGAIFNLGSLTIYESSASDNTANVNGGAVVNLGYLRSQDISFKRNAADAYGGAIFNLGRMNMNYVTLEQNTAGIDGGAVYNRNAHGRTGIGCIVDNSDTAVYNEGSEAYNARYIFWGSTNGPSGAGPGSGDTVSANVDYGSWYSSPFSRCVLSAPSVLMQTDAVRVLRSGNWQTVADERADGAAYVRSSSVEDALVIGFSGEEAKIVFVAGPGLGTARIEVDGQVFQEVYTGAETFTFGVTIALTDLDRSPHTLRIVTQQGVIAVDALTVPLISTKTLNGPSVHLSLPGN